MADNDISISSISVQKSIDTAQKFGVAVLKKAIDQQGQIASQLIAGANGPVLPEGKGNRVNLAA